jgi:NAD(P)-dependent dehydrogenase (short-subunit alcohol dehydrogenase family)
MRFKEKIVLVAGGTGGLGRAVSLAFLREGAEVVVTWRDEHELAALKSAAGVEVSRLGAEKVDVTDDAAVEQLIEGVVKEKGRLDAMVNTIGGFTGGTKMWEAAPESLDKMLAMNLRSGFLLSRAAVKAMIARGQGAIVNIAAKAAVDHPAGLAAYAASKAAALAMIDSLDADLKGTAVRVNSVLPSIIDTETNRKAMPNADFAKWPKPEDIAKVILFLCSDDAKAVHGAAIAV